MKKDEILTDFFNSVRDSNFFIQQQLQKKLESDFYEFMSNGKGELLLLDSVNEMCEQSLSPETFAMWDKVKEELRHNRRVLKLYDWKI